MAKRQLACDRQAKEDAEEEAALMKRQLEQVLKETDQRSTENEEKVLCSQVLPLVSASCTGVGTTEIPGSIRKVIAP